jgi:elongation factor 1-gamma
LIAAEYSGTEINVPPFEVGKDNKTAEFLKKFPLGKVSSLLKLYDQIMFNCSPC